MNLNQLGTKYGSTFRVEGESMALLFASRKGVKAAGVQASNLVTEIFVAMNRHHLLPLESVFVENENQQRL